MALESSLGNDAQELLRSACDELRGQLRAGQPARAETFLDAHPILASNPDWALDLILTEILVRRELGEVIDPQEVLARFRRWEELLRRQLDVLHLLDAPSAGDSTPADETVVHRLARTADLSAEIPELGRHERYERIGLGGMGEVYRARDLVLGRYVALKVMRSEVGDGPAMVARFYREAQAAARLRHPHIVPIHAIGRWDDRCCFTMPLFPDGSLDKHKGRYPDDARAAVALVEKVARAVQAAHEAGIIHRDLKPANILLDERGEPLVADFGLAKFSGEQGELTQSGDQLGTPAYMAPEQAAGHSAAVTAVSDVWSLGVILFELLTGQRPFPGKNHDEVARLVRTAEPLRPRTVRPGLPRDLEAVLLQCLEKKPARRYRSAGALADDLGRWLRGEPVLARTPSLPRRCGRIVRRHPRLSAAALLGGLLAAAVVLFLHFTDPDRPVGQAEARLARGEAVTLIGETGPPRWSRWCPDLEGVRSTPWNRDGTFTISSRTPALLELLRNPPESYRFSAEVRDNGAVDPGIKAGYVGVFLAWSRPSLDGEEHQFFCTWAFNEFTLPPGSGPGSERGRPSIPMSPASLTLGHSSPSINYSSYRLRDHLFPPRDQNEPLSWRQLAVEVRPGAVQLFWEGKPVGNAVPWDRVRAEVPKVRSKGAFFIALPPTLDLPLGPRQPLGLFVNRGEASFRRVTVEPLR